MWVFVIWSAGSAIAQLQKLLVFRREKRPAIYQSATPIYTPYAHHQPAWSSHVWMLERVKRCGAMIARVWNRCAVLQSRQLITRPVNDKPTAPTVPASVHCPPRLIKSLSQYFLDAPARRRRWWLNQASVVSLSPHQSPTAAAIAAPPRLWDLAAFFSYSDKAAPSTKYLEFVFGL